MKTLNFEYVKIHPKAVTPEKLKGNLGFDLSVVRDMGQDDPEYKAVWPAQNKTPFQKNSYGCYDFCLAPGERRIFRTGLKIAIQPGYGVIFYDRSGLGVIQGLTKHGGCIDCTYRGEWLVCLRNASNDYYTIKEGDRIIQCITIEEYLINFNENKKLDDTVRGEQGFGSSGR
jgi:dUTP pyrophosphatase